MSKEEAEGLLKVASKLIPFGIYAVEKNKEIELLKIKCGSKADLKQKKQLYMKRGFKVYANG